MRTTINLDDDVHEIVTYYANAKGISLSAAMNEIVRKGEKPLDEPQIVFSPEGFPMFPPTEGTVTAEMVKKIEEEEFDQGSLLDLNVLIALADQRHDHHLKARNWFASSGKDNWGICPLTEAGFLRVTTKPTFRPGPDTFGGAIAILQSLKGLPGYWYWPVGESWVTLTAPFVSRISGHQQVTDAYLLGLAIKEDGVLVTFDKGIRYMAGPEFSRNVLVLQ